MAHSMMEGTFARSSEEKVCSRRGAQTKKGVCWRRLQVKPYFGHFSGMWVTFDARTNSGSSSGSSRVRVKVEGSSTSSNLHLRYDRHSLAVSQSTMQAALRDMCLKYVHSLEQPTSIINRHPNSLIFLCEKKIVLHMNELNTSVLPSVSFSHLKPSVQSTEDVFVKVWTGLSSCPTTMLRIKIKKNMLVGELQWMIWCKLEVLSKFDPSSLELYEFSSTEKLSEIEYLKPNQVAFHCILASFIDRDSIVVSLVGHGIEQIKVKPSLTLAKFQVEVRKKFKLKESSYLYFPSICQKKLISSTNSIAMSVPLEVKTASMIDNRQRHLPLINNMPWNILKSHELEMYKLTMSDLNLLSSNLIHAYDITGPTIPISFRAATNVGKGEFVLISERVHAVSINIQWTVLTLLKYLENVSHFPCANISYQGSILPHSEVLER